jgi:ribonuclease-3
MKISRELEAFAARLGHRFADPALLVQAVTHPSMAAGTGGHNQRLEFLGDRVLNLLIAEALFKADVQAAEGTLAPRYNALVRKETCAEIARSLDLGAVLKLGRSEMQSGGRRKDALVADALEAVLAAVYLDAGLDAARDIVLRLWGDRIVKAETHVSNAKSELQEWAQGRGMATPDYVEIERAGPAHAPVFTVEARLADGRAARAEASSKRNAEQAAAGALLKKVQADD